ncbi:unnamed protein product [Vitrella brassicaformis CCMP3155]|uniref:Uncharacterized protein n=1 Tax=Vitrella brassicaformis (strain CCMP3155) TaxID=1169540 RepID=A0A0G4F353_VITBC|nr:unnamed protein product [Vitrella brassicaformis CCMP3155]|eukprot:CEM06474.1 unnamed protein product [Vitrella brassicaformis CCMP3155]
MVGLRLEQLTFEGKCGGKPSRREQASGTGRLSTRRAEAPARQSRHGRCVGLPHPRPLGLPLDGQQCACRDGVIVDDAHPAGRVRGVARPSTGATCASDCLCPCRPARQITIHPVPTTPHPPLVTLTDTLDTRWQLPRATWARCWSWRRLTPHPLTQPPTPSPAPTPATAATVRQRHGWHECQLVCLGLSYCATAAAASSITSDTLLPTEPTQPSHPIPTRSEELCPTMANLDGIGMGADGGEVSRQTPGGEVSRQTPTLCPPVSAQRRGLYGDTIHCVPE